VFNPKPSLERVAIGGGHTAWVVDNALLQPERLRDLAVQQRIKFVAAPHNAYPGLEWQMAQDVSGPLAEFFMLHLRSRLGARRTSSMYTRLSLATLQPPELRPLQRLCHRDRFGVPSDHMVAACVLYLFDKPELGGTSFYMPKRPLEDINADFKRWNSLSNEAFTHELGAAPAYLCASNPHFELSAVVPAAWNRVVFYDGGQFHSSHITQPALLSSDPAQGRLTLNGFFICKRAAS
jgi:hypothetical protein